MNYYSLEQLLQLIDIEYREQFQKILEDNRELFRVSPGSSKNHQAWEGGYIDHIVDIMNLSVYLYELMNSLRELPFTLSDALLVLFLHDIEKPWKHGSDELVKNSSIEPPASKSDEDVMKFRLNLMNAYNITLTENQMNGLKYVEGEKNDYTPNQRVMSPLAAFCHICDTTSARIWFDRPRKQEQEWGKRLI